MKVCLFKYQQEALNSLKTGAVLCGGVGSGKSIVALSYFFQKEHGDLYIITTARKRDTLEWEKELENFSLTASVDSWNNISKYLGVRNAFFIFDEQRAIGSGQWSKSFIKIAKQNRWIMLSATPGDSWMDYIPLFIANGFYKNRTEFLREHVIFSMYSKYPKVEGYRNVDKLVRLRRDILITMDSKRSRDISYERIVTKFDTDIYKQAEATRWNPFEDSPMMDISELCRVLRKIVNSDDSRVNALHKLYIKHNKIIVFYNFDYELYLLEKFCEKNSITYSQWNGHKHEPISSKDKWLYLVQYTAGAEGWNCIETDTIVFYSLNYSYKIMVQSAGRIDRINTPYKTLYYYLLYSNSSIDKAISRALINKQDFNEKMFSVARARNICYNG